MTHTRKISGAMKSEYDSMYPYTELTLHPFHDYSLAMFAADCFNKVDKRPGMWGVKQVNGIYRVYKLHHPMFH